MPPPPWWPRTEPTGRTDLSAARITAVASDLIDAEGVEKVSIRQLAKELETGVMTLYWHVKDKEQLFDLILDELIGEVETPVADLPWHQQLAGYARNLRRTIVDHRRMAPLFGSAHSTGPNALALAEAMTTIIADAGFPPTRVPSIYQTILHFTIGSALNECLEPDTPEDLAKLDAAHAPTLTTHRNHFSALTPDQSFEEGLALVLRGIGEPCDAT